MNSLARLVSYIFHPLLLATYFFSLLAKTLPTALDPIKPSSFNTIIFLVFIVTFLLPVLNLGIFKAFGTIRSFHLEDRRERILPFTFITAIYLIITYLFYSRTGIGLNDSFLRLMFILDLLVLVATITTFFFKVSVHSLAIWGIIGIMVPLNKLTEVPTLFYPTLGVILLAGIIMSSRLYLNAHTLREVMWGGVLGLATGIAGMFTLFGG